MQETELFLSLAEIAGVFVGFGALIAIRGGGTSDAWSVASIGMVVEYGIMVVALALAPVAIGRFAVADRALWVSCSLIFLALFWLGDAAMMRAFPERREILGQWALVSARTRRIIYAATFAVTIPMTIALVVVVLGVRPDLDAALYFAALALLLLVDAGQLLWTVVGVARPTPA